jgi:hypothetical protein
MTQTAVILLAASMLGAFDVFYFHLYRLRLYRQPGSFREELTHLLGYAMFIAIATALITAKDATQSRGLVIGLFALNLIVTAVDVLLERESRADLGGLPSIEYLLHVIVTFGIGAAGATFWWTTRTGTATVLAGSDRMRVFVSIVFTTTLFLVEGTLVTRASLNRHHSRGTPHSVAQ